MDPKPLQFWHGAQRWTGQPELRPCRPKSYECGPGLYLTNRYATARKYAKGGGQTVLITLEPDVTLLEDVRLPLATLLEGLAELPRVRGRQEIRRRLEEAAAYQKQPGLPASYLLNNCINTDSLGGDTGPVLARWFVAQGIDVSRYDRPGDEDWLVVFNMDKIERARPMKADDAYALGDFPTLPQQRMLVGPAVEEAVASLPRAPRIR